MSGNGGLCTEGGDYESRKCNEGLCSECLANTDCTSDKYCLACKGYVHKHNNGTPCLTGNNCKSGKCNGGTCSECSNDRDYRRSTHGCLLGKACVNKVDYCQIHPCPFGADYHVSGKVKCCKHVWGKTDTNNCRKFPRRTPINKNNVRDRNNGVCVGNPETGNSPKFWPWTAFLQQRYQL